MSLHPLLSLAPDPVPCVCLCLPAEAPAKSSRASTGAAHDSVVPFAEIVTDCEAYDVCRRFLATLQLVGCQLGGSSGV
jgi:hypothetical protein